MYLEGEYQIQIEPHSTFLTLSLPLSLSLFLQIFCSGPNSIESLLFVQLNTQKPETVALIFWKRFNINQSYNRHSRGVYRRRFFFYLALAPFSNFHTHFLLAQISSRSDQILVVFQFHWTKTADMLNKKDVICNSYYKRTEGTQLIHWNFGIQCLINGLHLTLKCEMSDFGSRKRNEEEEEVEKKKLCDRRLCVCVVPGWYYILSFFSCSRLIAVNGIKLFWFEFWKTIRYYVYDFYNFWVTSF